MSRKRKLLRGSFALAALLGVYPFCILAFTWSHVMRSDFEGGRHGQLDAYRHALASAAVSYTLGEWAVDLTSAVFERHDKDSHRMDRRNNRIGAGIGSRVESFGEIEPAVRRSVRNGAVDAADVSQITWLPENKWRDGTLW